MTVLYAALTDLWAPDADAAEGLARLPCAEALLSRAESRATHADWRRWALELAGLAPPPGDLPVALTLARHHGAAAEPGTTWFVATPVHFVAGLTRVRFDARGALALPPGAAAALAGRLAADWADPALALVEAGGALLLRVRGRYEVQTRDPVACAGREVGEALPTGPDAGRLERLMTELQMWLHTAPPASADGVPVNGLWLWGGGHEPLAGSAAWPALGDADPFLAAAAAAVPGRALDARLEAWSVAALARAGQPLAALDARAFAPLAAALRRGTIGEARLHAGAREFALRPHQRWRRWRRVRPWWEVLG